MRPGVPKSQIPTFSAVQKDCGRKNFKLLFCVGIASAVGVRIYIFRQMRMTDAILPGSPPRSNIKGRANHFSPSFRFLLAGSKDRPVDTRENTPLSLSLSLSQADSNSRHWDISSRESTFNICSSASFRIPFLINYFSLLNQMDLEWVLNSCTAIYNCPSSHSTKENFVSSCH